MTKSFAENIISFLQSEIAWERLIPNNSVFYHPEEHQRKISIPGNMGGKENGRMGEGEKGRRREWERRRGRPANVQTYECTNVQTMLMFPGMIAFVTDGMLVFATVAITKKGISLLTC